MTSKNLVVQFYCSLGGYSQPKRLKKHDEVMSLSTKLARHYAEKNGADYVLVTEPRINFRHPTYERFDLWENDYWAKYDRILYLDTDVFCWPEAPNIFKEFPGQEFKVARHSAWEEYRGDPDDRFEDGDFKGMLRKDLNAISFNAGVFMLTKQARDLMAPFLKYRSSPDNSDDSKELHRLILESKVPLLIIDPTWNMKNAVQGTAHFSHLWGNSKHKQGRKFPPVVQARNALKSLNLIQDSNWFTRMVTRILG